ncbi:hypothetical protein DRN69_01830 [Candidatus Pacearchaeota archaeon]|nr:MAG: hypothetical protein DRN69_01830 [Candidatus Pacearchaeota archaeon]
MRYPLDELLDKRSIVQLKIENFSDKEADKRRLEKEYQDYTCAIIEYINENVCTKEQVERWHKELYDANKRTWNLEADIRKGQIGHLTLEEIGKTAIAIRESNGIRVGIKSKIVRETGVGYKEIKINHASQDTLNEYLRNYK